jgi:hypothetical protein
MSDRKAGRAVKLSDDDGLQLWIKAGVKLRHSLSERWQQKLLAIGSY